MRRVPGRVLPQSGRAACLSEAFVNALTKAGWLAALIPQEYGGSGLGLTEASVIMEINRCGGNSGACHGQMYNMGTLLRHGEAQKQKYLPKIASGEWRLQSMGVTEPTTGTDTTKIKTKAEKKDGRYVVNGQKVWISRVQHSDWMILLARTTPLAEVKKKSEGMSIFMVDLHEAQKKGMIVRPIPNMVNHETNELFFEDTEIPEENLIGEEGKGFKYILDGLNAERTLIAAECIGDGYWFMDRVTRYVKERRCSAAHRPEPGVQFPIAETFIELEAANLMRWKACELFDAHQPMGAQANMAKYRRPRRAGRPATPACSSMAVSASPASTTWSASSARRACTGGADLDQPDLFLRGRAHPRPAALVLSPRRPSRAGRAARAGHVTPGDCTRPGRPYTGTHRGPPGPARRSTALPRNPSEMSPPPPPRSGSAISRASAPGWPRRYGRGRRRPHGVLCAAVGERGSGARLPAGRGVATGDRVLVVAENCGGDHAAVRAVGARRRPVVVNARLSEREVDEIHAHCRPRRRCSPMARRRTRCAMACAIARWRACCPASAR